MAYKFRAWAYMYGRIAIHCCFEIGRKSNKRLYYENWIVYFGYSAERMSRKLSDNRVIRPASLSEAARMSSCDAEQTRVSCAAQE